MNLLEAYSFVWSIRPSWQPSAGGYTPMMINSRHVLNVLGEGLDINELEPMSYIKVQQELTKQGIQAATINRCTSTLSVVVGEMVKHKHLPHRIEFSQLTEPKGKTLFYTEDEVQRILSAAKEMDEETYFLYFLASKTGARKGELSKLVWEDIDFDANELTFFDTKNGDDRVLPLTSDLRELLLLKYHERIDDGKVFSINPTTALNRLRSIQKRLGISTKKCFHTFRHTAATLMFSRGAALPEVQEVLGHRNSATTMRYSHATLEGKKRALAYL